LALVLLLATLFLATQLGQLRAFGQVLAQGQPAWIALALVVEAIWQFNQAAEFQAAHRAAGVEQRVPELLPAVAANNFVILALPSGSVSTYALFIENARRRGLPPERVALAVAIYGVFQYLALAVMVSAGLAALAAQGVLHPAAWVPGLVVVAVALGQYAALWIGLRSPVRLERLSAWLARPINRLARRVARRDVISVGWLHSAAANAAGGLTTMSEQGLRAHLWPLAYALSGKALQVLLLGLTLRAFGQPASPGVMVAGVGLAGLFTVIAPTPVGLGVVEGALVIALKSLGLNLEAAVIVSLAFRILTLWLPMLYGFLALQWAGLTHLTKLDGQTTEGATRDA
jgi:uncharacterized membrane protein YbhN (UPF0104 family)